MSSESKPSAPRADSGLDQADTLIASSAHVVRKKVGPYQLVERVGGGGMGIVFRALAPDGSTVALKVLRQIVLDAHLLRRFEREANVRIEHPNVVRVLDAGAAEDGTPYIAFELLEGESLEARLGRGRLTVAETVDLGVQTCAGLAAVHARGIVHRDLKPGNLFLGDDRRVKVLDFGIAHLSSSETALTAAGTVLGTPTYLAPEQARGEATHDPGVDVWALGAVLYQCLAGQSPFARDTPLATMLAILIDDVPPLAVAAPGIPGALAHVVERALKKPRRERWGSIREMGEMLSEIDPSSTVLEPPVTVSITAGEQRVVAVVLAEGVRERGRIEQAVRARRGIVLPLAGPRMLAVFGAEHWEGDEIVRAVEAGLEARGAAERVAVGSGRATRAGSGIAGDALRAAELGLSASLPGVAVDVESMRAVGERFAIRRVDTRIGEAIERRPTSRPGTTPGDPHEPDLLGREVERMQMELALRTVIEARRAVTLVISGPAGIGKTRLRRELERMLNQSGEEVQVLFGRAEPQRRDAALSVFAGAIRGRAGVVAATAESALVPTEAVARLAREAIDDDAAATECAQFLGELIGVAMPETVSLRAARGDAQLMADRVRMAIHDWVAGRCARGPVALLLEDLHWADAASIALLEDLVDRLADQPLLVLITARPELDERFPRLLANAEVTRLRPRGLPAEAVGKLARRIGGVEIAPRVLERIVERTAGNPLFVEQVVLAAKDEGALGSDAADLPLPLTVEAAVQSRLDHLPPPEKELIKRVSVFQRPFTPAEAGMVVGEPDVGALINGLMKRDLLGRGRSRDKGAAELSFRNALVAEVAYRMLADEVRTELHRMVAAALDAGDSDPEEVASHYERGSQPARAAARWADATALAARRGDGSSVLRCAERALSLGAAPDRWFALHMARADALRFLGRRDEQATELDLALQHAADAKQRARAAVERAVIAARIGRGDEAREVADRALEGARAARDPEVLALALVRRAAVSTQSGGLADAEALLDEAGVLRDGVGPLIRAAIAGGRAYQAAARGDLEGRVAAFGDAAAGYREAGDMRRAANAEMNVADSLVRLGRYEAATEELRKAIDESERLGNRVTAGYASLNLGYALAMLGRAPQALEALDDAADVARAAKEARLAALVSVYRARALWVAERADESLRAAEAGAEQCAAAGLRAFESIAWMLAARVALAKGDVAGALERSQRAVAIREQLGALEEDEAEVFLVHARALHAAGRREEALRWWSEGGERVRAAAATLRDESFRSSFVGAIASHRELLNGQL